MISNLVENEIFTITNYLRQLVMDLSVCLLAGLAVSRITQEVEGEFSGNFWKGKL